MKPVAKSKTAAEKTTAKPVTKPTAKAIVNAVVAAAKQDYAVADMSLAAFGRKEPVIRAPLSGCAFENSSRIDIKPGISVSAMFSSLRPKAARLMSATA